MCGLALIGTDVGGIPEQINHGQNGLLVPVDDVAALTNALEKVTGDPTYRYNLSRIAWDKAKNTYSMSRVVQQLKTVYRSYRKEE